MKQAGLLLIAGFFLILNSSCQKAKDDINKATEFTMNYSNEVSVPGSTVVATLPLEVSTPEFPTNSKNRFVDEKTTENLIEDVFLSRLSISTTAPDLDFLNSIEIFIKASGATDVKVASRSQIPKGVSTVDLDVTKNDIKHFIFKEKIQFRVVANVTTGSGVEQKIKMDEQITVRGKRL